MWQIHCAPYPSVRSIPPRRSMREAPHSACHTLPGAPPPLRTPARLSVVSWRRTARNPGRCGAPRAAAQPRAAGPPTRARAAAGPPTRARAAGVPQPLAPPPNVPVPRGPFAARNRARRRPVPPVRRVRPGLFGDPIPGLPPGEAGAPGARVEGPREQVGREGRGPTTRSAASSRCLFS